MSATGHQPPLAQLTARQPLKPFAFVQERDIDFLLVEELTSSLPFRRLVLGKALPGVDIASLIPEVAHSVARTGAGPGETDIQVFLTPVSGPAAPGPDGYLVLIENKVDAPFQPDQAGRYTAAAAEAVSGGGFVLARTVLIAPEKYLQSRPEAMQFDVRVSYEAVEEYFQRRARRGSMELRTRFMLHAQLVRLAADKTTRGIPSVPNAAITDFWRQYYRLVRAEAPSLRMNQPGEQGNQSTWIRFSGTLTHHPPLPRAVLIHKLPHARVHLEFPGWANEMQRLGDALKASGAPADMHVQPAGGSAAIAIDVEPIDPQKPFSDQVDRVREGVNAAARLEKWWAANWRLLGS